MMKLVRASVADLDGALPVIDVRSADDIVAAGARPQQLTGSVIGAFAVSGLVLAAIGLTDWVQTVIWLVRWPVLLVFVILGLAVLYRFGPSRREPKWQWVSPDSLLAAVAWLAGSLLLSWYLQNFANYNATYGSLGAAIGFMMWLWISSIVILLGAELNSEIEHQTARDSTIGPEKPLGTRGAVMADTIGKAQA